MDVADPRPTRARLDRLLRRLLRPAYARQGWRIWHLPAALLLTVIGLAVTSHAWADIYSIGSRDEESSHIFLVPIVVAALLWVRRERLRICRPTGTWLGPVLILAGWALTVVGDIYLKQALWHLGAVVIVVGCVASVVGRMVLARFFPAFLVLLFLVPVPGMVRQELAFPLQTVTAQLTHAALETVGIDVTLAGNLISLNGVDVAVAEACNGLRMMFALTLVSFAFAFSTPLRQGARVLVLIASPLTAVVCNVIRLVPTVWIYGNASVEVADMFHEISGWVMLPVAFMALMGVVRALRWAHVPVARFTLAYGS